MRELLDTKLFDMNQAASHPGWLAGAPHTHTPETEESVKVQKWTEK